jgi:hypothetical protein
MTIIKGVAWKEAIITKLSVVGQVRSRIHIAVIYQQQREERRQTTPNNKTYEKRRSGPFHWPGPQKTAGFRPGAPGAN